MIEELSAPTEQGLVSLQPGPGHNCAIEAGGVQTDLGGPPGGGLHAGKEGAIGNPAQPAAAREPSRMSVGLSQLQSVKLLTRVIVPERTWLCSDSAPWGGLKRVPIRPVSTRTDADGERRPGPQPQDFWTTFY